MTTASAVNALIVEDNVLFRRAFKAFLLERFPFLRIVEAGDAVEAIREIEALIPHLIFMDILLPGMSGIQLTKQIKARHPEVKIVVVTNHGEPEFRAEALASKADAFFLKEAVGGEEFAALIESISSQMGIDFDGSGREVVPDAQRTQDPAHWLPNQPEANNDEEEVEGQGLTKLEVEFA